MKKLLSLILALAMLLTVMAGLMASASAEEDTFHIGIVTGSVSQSEDDRRGAEAFQEKYGEDRVKLAIYPDNFTEVRRRPRQARDLSRQLHRRTGNNHPDHREPVR